MTTTITTANSVHQAVPVVKARPFVRLASQVSYLTLPQHFVIETKLNSCFKVTLIKSVMLWRITEHLISLWTQLLWDKIWIRQWMPQITWHRWCRWWWWSHWTVQWINLLTKCNNNAEIAVKDVDYVTASLLVSSVLKASHWFHTLTLNLWGMYLFAEKIQSCAQIKAYISNLKSASVYHAHKVVRNVKTNKCVVAVKKGCLRSK